MIARIRIRRDTRDNWIEADPILGLAEMAIVLNELPTPVRIGDGKRKWSEIPEQYFNTDRNGLTLAGIAQLNTTPLSTKGFWIASRAGTYKGFDNLEVPKGKVFIFLYDGDKWIATDSGIFSYEGIDDVKAYYSPPEIGINGNWWLWNPEKGMYVDSGVSARGIPGTPGDAAGFGKVTAEVIPIEDPEVEPTVDVETWGPNTQKNIHFTFRLPKGTEVKSFIKIDLPAEGIQFDYNGGTKLITVESNSTWVLEAKYL